MLIDGDGERTRLEAPSPGELLDMIDETPNVAALTVAIDSAFCSDLSNGVDDDEFIALASVLVQRGVRAFETRRPDVLTRILAMHAAIVTGSTEVLTS